MIAADLIARAESRARAVRLSASAARILVAVLVIVAVYWRGGVDGRRRAELNHVDVQLAANAKQLAVDTHHRDTTKADAAKQVARSAAQRIGTRRAQSRVRIVDDSTVDVVLAGDPAHAPTDTLKFVILRDTIPPAVIIELREDRAQITQDSITIRAQAADVSALEHVVSDQSERLALQDVQSHLGARAAFWRGVKWGLGGAAALAAVAAVVF